MVGARFLTMGLGIYSSAGEKAKMVRVGEVSKKIMFYLTSI